MLRHLLRTVNLFDTAKSALFLCFLAACHSESGGRAEGRGLVYYETYDPRSLDPALSTDVPTGEMAALLFDGLTQFDADGHLLPGLSDRWTSDRRALHYVFHLRPAVTFHDGRPLVAADVKRALLRVLSPETHGGRVSVTEIPCGETARWEQDHAEGRKRKPALRAVYVALNNRRGPLHDPNVRRAINHAVNVPEILRTVWSGRGERAAGAIPPALGGSDIGRKPYAYDTATARRLLRAAGFGDGFAVQLWRSGTNVELGRVAQAIQSQLAAVGIRVEIVSRDASSMRDAVRKGDTDMAILDWWADYPDADNFLYPLFHSASFGPGGNYSFYSDAVTDSLILVARRTVDQREREAFYTRIDGRVFEAAPWIYLWFPVDLWAVRPAIDGWDVPVIFNGQRWTKARVK